MLQLHNVQVNYGAAPSLWGIDLEVRTGELVSVIGPNGAGKTTLIHAIMGLNRLSGGTISWEGEVISTLPPSRLCERGLALVPESRRLFTGMTVRDSLERVCDLFPAVRQKLSQVSGTLSGGQQQMVAIGRALMALPRVLLLDEPSLGLAPTIVSDLFRVIQSIHQAGTAVMLVEQNVSRALAISSRTYVLENGRVIAQGASDELANRPEIRKAYLGL